LKAFGPFLLDTVNHCLWRSNQRVPLAPKSFDVLRYLIDHSGRLVTQNELLEALWPDTYVNPEGIRKYILEIRKVLGDRSKPAVFVETLPKRGYQFIAAITETRDAARTEAAAQLPGNIVGRQAGLKELYAYLEAASGAQRQVVFVTGEAGIGKTTLLDAFQQQALRRPDIRVARGQCIEGFGGLEAYYPMLEALGSLLQAAHDDSLVQVFAERAPTWLVQFPALIKPALRESLQREILGSTRARMVRELCEVLETMTARSPLIVILEDMHWVDTSTLDLISAFARRRGPARVLLIGTYRPVDVVLSQSPLKALKQDLVVRDLCHEITIERLEESDVAEYLAKEFPDSRLPSGLATMIHRNSGGNALFMAAIVRDIVKRGLIVQSQGSWTLTRPLEDVYPGIPETLQQMLEIQFEQLTVEDQRILESCSVAGERFSAWAVAAMLEASPESVEETCDKLVQRQQFVRFLGVHPAPHGADSPFYEFGHSLYRQALYRRLSNVNRPKLHRRLGERLWTLCVRGKPELAGEVALHFEKGGNYEQATRCLTLAAENAVRRFAYRDSIQVLQHALELAPLLPAGRRVELEAHIFQCIGDSHYSLGAMSEAASAYETSAARAADGGLGFAQIEALSRLAFPVWGSDPDRASRICDETIAVARAHADPLVLAHTQLAAACFRLLYESGDPEEAEACASARQAIRLLGGSGPDHVYYACVRAVEGHYEEALRQAEAVMIATTNPAGRLLAQGARMIGLIGLGRLGEVLRMVRSGRELAEKNGEDPWLFILRESWLRGICFDFEGVFQLNNVILRNDPEQHAMQPRTIALLASGYTKVFQGRCQESLPYFAKVRDPQQTPKFFLHWLWRLYADLGTAEAFLFSRDVANASLAADAFLRSALSTVARDMQAHAWDVKSRAASAGRDLDSALECISHALALLDQFEIPLAGWQVHRTAGKLYAELGDSVKAAEHRACAQEIVMRLADSFEPEEPLRASFLGAPGIRRLFECSVSA
jgi:DNA-binding winged helix-turn-helix (wHTH) protein/tetratricopeptide (TPR) repeat protein